MPIPPGHGFGLFTPTHFIILGVLALLIACLTIVYKHSSDHRRHSIRLVLAIALFASDYAQQIAKGAMHVWNPTVLPLWLCSITTIVTLVDAIHPSRWTRETLYAVGIWAAACALIFADWADRPWFNIFSWQSFLVHAGLFAYPLMLLVTGELVPNWRNLWRVAIILAVAVTPAVIVNHFYGTNFWFLNSGSPGSPLDPLLQATGRWYVPALVVLLGLLWCLLYLPWAPVRRRRLAQEKRRASVDASSDATPAT